MGAVYEVEHLHTGQRLALKVLSAAARGVRRAVQARVARRVAHQEPPHRADHGRRPGARARRRRLSSSWSCSRERTSSALTGKNPTPPADVIDWLRQVARALARAHDAGIIHRDLKPENLFLTRREDGVAARQDPRLRSRQDGRPKGVAHAVGRHSWARPLTWRRSRPTAGARRSRPRTDVYALGLIAFRLLTGRVYWREGSLAQILVQILAEPMPPASERGSTFGEPFDAWFRRACDRDPDQRFVSAVEQVQALAVALGLPESGYPAAPDSIPASSAPPSSSSPYLARSPAQPVAVSRRLPLRRWLAGGGGLVVVGMAFAGLSIRSGAGVPPPPAQLPSAGSALSLTPLPSDDVPSGIAPPPLVASDPERPDGAVASSSSVGLQPSARPSAGAPPARKQVGPTAPSVDSATALDPLKEPY